jgi:membrane protein implicated in regulation of membrane protease activity
MAVDTWLIWLAVAVVLVVAEIMTASFFLLWFGIGAAVASAIAYFSPDSSAWQLGAFVVVSGALFAISRPIAEKFTKDQPPGIGADRFVGQTGVVLEEIDNVKNTGRVRTAREEWRADSASGDVIPEGERVNVIRLDGTHLVVEKLKEDG